MNNPHTVTTQRQAFLEALQVRRYSPATRKTYDRSLTVFFHYLNEQNITDTRDVNRQTLRDYQLWLQQQQYKPWTRITHLHALRRFFAHLETTDAILVNPCNGLLCPQRVERLPQVILTPAEAKALLNAPDTQTPIGIRDKAILEMFYSTGIRLEEMARLTLHDVDHRHGYLRVNKGKCAKDRVVPLGRKASEYAREYLQKIRHPWSQTNPDERAFWLSSKTPHAPLKSQLIAVMVKHYARKIGLTKPVTPHVWRHTCATHMLNDGANILYVQRLLGHRSLSTTQIYTRATITDLKQTHAKTHPQERARTRQHKTYQPAIAREGHPLRYRKNAT